MNHLKLFENFNQDQIDLIEDLFLMYFVDEWGAKDTLKVPKETVEDYQNYITIPITYRFAVEEGSRLVRCSLFISPNLVDMDKLLSDIKKFIERVRISLKSNTFSCRDGFQESTSGAKKKVYVIRFLVA